MKLFAAAALLLSLAVPGDRSTAPGIGAFRYTREVLYPPASPQNPSPNACVLLDAEVFEHTRTGLPDLRVFDAAGKSELPYAITLSSASATSDPARVVRIAPSGARQLTLDLEMPHRPYSEVDLSLDARDFVASAHVTGLQTPADDRAVFLGDISLFDLTSRHLGSSTALPIAESTFPYLRLRLAFEPVSSHAGLSIAPSMTISALVPPTRQAQTLYTGIAQTSTIAQRGQQSVATFSVPAHVPIERVSFDLDPAEGSNFNRPAIVSASTSQSSSVETVTGQISRVHLNLGDARIERQSLSIPAILASNGRSPATVEVAVQNGERPPVKLRDVRLEMRQRQLCFPAAGTGVTLAYGSPSGMAQPPVYDFAGSFDAAASIRQATLLPERANALFVPPPTSRFRFNRNPAFLGLSILVALSLLGVIGYRALHRGHRDSLSR